MDGDSSHRLTGSEIHGFHTMEDLDVKTMLEEAKSMWLRPNEIHAVLYNPQYFTINVKPLNLPNRLERTSSLYITVIHRRGKIAPGSSAKTTSRGRWNFLHSELCYSSSSRKEDVEEICLYIALKRSIWGEPLKYLFVLFEALKKKY